MPCTYAMHRDSIKPYFKTLYATISLTGILILPNRGLFKSMSIADVMEGIYYYLFRGVYIYIYNSFT
jgi:hypothetical protein